MREYLLWKKYLFFVALFIAILSSCDKNETPAKWCQINALIKLADGYIESFYLEKNERFVRMHERYN